MGTFSTHQKEVIWYFSFFTTKIALVKSRSTLKIGWLCKWMAGIFLVIVPLKGQIISWLKLPVKANNKKLSNLWSVVSNPQNAVVISCCLLDPSRSYCRWKWMWKSTLDLKLFLTCRRDRRIVFEYVPPYFLCLKHCSHIDETSKRKRKLELI